MNDGFSLLIIERHFTLCLYKTAEISGDNGPGNSDLRGKAEKIWLSEIQTVDLHP